MCSPRRNPICILRLRSERRAPRVCNPSIVINWKELMIVYSVHYTQARLLALGGLRKNKVALEPFHCRVHVSTGQSELHSGTWRDGRVLIVMLHGGKDQQQSLRSGVAPNSARVRSCMWASLYRVSTCQTRRRRPKANCLPPVNRSGMALKAVCSSKEGPCHIHVAHVLDWRREEANNPTNRVLLPCMFAMH